MEQFPKNFFHVSFIKKLLHVSFIRKLLHSEQFPRFTFFHVPQ